MNAALLVVSAAFMLAQPAWADQRAMAAEQAQDLRPGARTEALLELQRSDRKAGKSQPLRGEQAEAARRRYQNSFGHPIPDHYPATPAAGAATQR